MICAINPAPKMLIAILDYPFCQQLSLGGGFQPPPSLRWLPGWESQNQQREMQGLKENRDNLSTTYLKAFIGGKLDDIYRGKSSMCSAEHGIPVPSLLQDTCPPRSGLPVPIQGRLSC